MSKPAAKDSSVVSTKRRRLALIGMQWGDEGKGKLIDALAHQTTIDYVVRYQGGHNAGHTVIFNDKQGKEQKLVLHLLPSAVMNPASACVIANGTVVYLPALTEEIAKVTKNLNASDEELKQRLFISRDCPAILPSHLALDQAAEKKRANKSIGTTGRGIGPAYEDYYARRGIKLHHFSDTDFGDKLKEVMDYHNFLLSKFYETDTVDYQKTYDELQQQFEQASRTANFVDTAELLQQAVSQAGTKILFEGAQGYGLDVHHGTYPYVTSSTTSIGGVLSGSGVCHKDIDSVLGVTKIYTTRVGEGPFPTELNDAVGEAIQKKGNEFGSTTGRARRCGWLDLAYLRKAVKLNGVEFLFLTKVDVFDELPKINMCLSYNDKGEPVYKEYPGWQTQTGAVTSYQDLPQQLKDIVSVIEQETGAKVIGLSVGPERTALINCGEVWS